MPVIATGGMIGCTSISLGGNMTKQDQDHTELTKFVAEKIKDLVDDRDFLNWGDKKAHSPAAPVIEKLIAKAPDEDKDGNPNPLHEAGRRLTIRFGNDRQRKVLLIRGALTVLTTQRDNAAVKSTARAETLTSVSALQANPGRNTSSAPRVSSPFLV